MFFYKVNPWNNKLYKYDSDEYDLFSPMFDHNLHINEKIPQIINPYVCGYCGTSFDSRNRLFYHLGYNGIDIKDQDHEEEHYKQRRKRNKRKKYYNHTSPSQTPTKKRYRIDDLEREIKFLKL
jgi:hypothetical protein